MVVKKTRSRYIVERADEARSSIPTTAANIARVSGCSPASIKHVLEGKPKTRIICERFVIACKSLGCDFIGEANIVEIMG